MRAKRLDADYRQDRGFLMPLLESVEIGLGGGELIRIQLVLVDSGAAISLARNDVAHLIGVTDIQSGERQQVTGVGGSGFAYGHRVRIVLGEGLDFANSLIYFCQTLPYSMLLGQDPVFIAHTVVFRNQQPQPRFSIAQR